MVTSKWLDGCKNAHLDKWIIIRLIDDVLFYVNTIYRKREDMKRCPKCRTPFSSSVFQCECGAVFKNGKWTNLYDKKSVARMDKFFYENTYLHYLKDIPPLLQQEVGDNFLPYVGYQRIKTRKNNIVLIFRAIKEKDIFFIAWNITNDMVYRCRTGPRGTSAYVGSEAINNLEEWYRYLKHDA